MLNLFGGDLDPAALLILVPAVMLGLVVAARFLYERRTRRLRQYEVDGVVRFLVSVVIAGLHVRFLVMLWG